MKEEIAKESRELARRQKVMKRRKRSIGDGKGKVLEEPVWGNLKFLKKAFKFQIILRKSFQQERKQTELVEYMVSRVSRRGFSVN